MATFEMGWSVSEAYPLFKIGALKISDVSNAGGDIAEQVKTAHSFVRNNLERCLSATEPMSNLYKRLNPKARYHIASLIRAAASGRDYRGINPLVDLVYCVELKNALLMGLHDLDALSTPMRVETNQDNTRIKHISGKVIDIPRSDIVLFNGDEPMASIAGGPDSKTKVTVGTTNVLVTAFGSEGDDEAQLEAALIETRDRCISSFGLSKQNFSGPELFTA